MLNFKTGFTLHGHSAPVNVLRFSPDGKRLASAADDGYIRIWNVQTGKVEQVLSAYQGPVTIVEWIQQSNVLGIISAGADGTIKLWKKTVSTAKFGIAAIHTAFDHAIENSAINAQHNVVAVCGGGHIAVLSVHMTGTPPRFHEFGFQPPRRNPPFRALARTIHFINDENTIIIGFLNSKELSSWKIHPLEENWCVKLHTRIGNSAWCSETRLLLVWNLSDGIDVYHIMDRPVFMKKLQMEVARLYPFQVEFAQHGSIAICGSDTGKVCIWELETQQIVTVLAHGHSSLVVQTVAVHALPNGSFSLATASSDPVDESPSIKLWLPSPTHRGIPWALIPRLARIAGDMGKFKAFSFGIVIGMLLASSLAVYLFPF